MILIEPLVGKEIHVAFLSAFILAVKKAYPDEKLEFWSNSGKNNAIKSMLSLNGDISDIFFMICTVQNSQIRFHGCIANYH